LILTGIKFLIWCVFWKLFDKNTENWHYKTKKLDMDNIMRWVFIIATIIVGMWCVTSPSKVSEFGIQIIGATLIMDAINDILEEKIKRHERK